MFRYLIVLTLPWLLIGCSDVRSSSSDLLVASAANRGMETSMMFDGSLFPADTQALSNEAVDKILAGKLELKENGRLAVLPIGGWNYHETGELGKYINAITEAMKPSPYVGEVVQIPRVLMPNQVTVPVLREVGARLQCENILAYNISFDMHYQRNLFTKDESRNRVTVEAIILNVRTGVIPVTVIHDKMIDFTQKSGEDAYEFVRRLQRETAIIALQEASDQVQQKLQ
jgi:hypothetical protein